MKNNKVRPPAPVICTISVAICQMCGRRLTSDFGLKNGMGPKCMRKWERMHAPADPGQITFFDMEGEDENK